MRSSHGFSRARPYYQHVPDHNGYSWDIYGQTKLPGFAGEYLAN
jgi:hypothetical protein